MNGVLSASKLMKASEVVKKCAETRNNPAMLLITELEAKRKMYEMNRKVSTRRPTMKSQG
ncbi:hypothetical protein V6946_27730 [Bacillus sp. PPSBB_2]|uniref:hypothetical protein n=1 Tax=Bacillus sp. PPSBB_2 TaxID=3123319 RepID=UPI00325485C3